MPVYSIQYIFNFIFINEIIFLLFIVPAGMSSYAEHT